MSQDDFDNIGNGEAQHDADAADSTSDKGKKHEGTEARRSRNVREPMMPSDPANARRLRDNAKNALSETTLDNFGDIGNGEAQHYADAAHQRPRYKA